MPRLLPGPPPKPTSTLLPTTKSALGVRRLKVAKALLDSGIKILQYREKKKKAGQMLKEPGAVPPDPSEVGACFIVNDHVDIAVLCGSRRRARRP